jgi:flagellar L-ring protein precursor FlgH
MHVFKLAALLTLTAALAGCSTMDRLASVGSAPPLTAIADPTTTAGYQPVRMPMPEAIADTYQANSLYRTSARGFFKDERAHRIGDILTVLVTIDDSAKIANTTQSAATPPIRPAWVAFSASHWTMSPAAPSIPRPPSSSIPA